MKLKFPSHATKQGLLRKQRMKYNFWARSLNRISSVTEREWNPLPDFTDLLIVQPYCIKYSYFSFGMWKTATRWEHLWKSTSQQQTHFVHWLQVSNCDLTGQKSRSPEFDLHYVSLKINLVVHEQNKSICSSLGRHCFSWSILDLHLSLLSRNTSHSTHSHLFYKEEYTQFRHFWNIPFGTHAEMLQGISRTGSVHIDFFNHVGQQVWR